MVRTGPVYSHWGKQREKMVHAVFVLWHTHCNSLHRRLLITNLDLSRSSKSKSIAANFSAQPREMLGTLDIPMGRRWVQPTLASVGLLLLGNSKPCGVRVSNIMAKNMRYCARYRPRSFFPHLALYQRPIATPIASATDLVDRAKKKKKALGGKRKTHSSSSKTLYSSRLVHLLTPSVLNPIPHRDAKHCHHHQRIASSPLSAALF